MTVSSSQSKVSYAGDGATTVFPVPFAFVLNADIVAVKAAADGTEIAWVENTHYTLAGAGEPSGGTLTVLTAPDDRTPANGETLTIRRVVALTQETDYPEGGEFPAQAHERALDKLTHAVQQLDEAQGRALSLPVTSPVSDAAVPAPAAQKYLRWNAAGDGLENATLPDGTVVLSDEAPAALDGTAAAGTSGEVSRADHRHADATAVRGDLLVRDEGGTARLPVGAARRALVSDGADPAWGGGLDADAEFALSGTVTPAQITADQDDYAPAGLAAASTLRLSSDAARSLSGLSGGFDGRVIVVHNVGTSPLVLAHEGAGSAAANRFLLGADAALGADRTAVLRYDGASARWRMVAGPGGVEQSAGIWTPALTFAAPGDLNVAYSAQDGTYVKIGNLVFATFQISTSTFTHSTSSGDCQITGLPFTSANETGNSASGVMRWAGIDKTSYDDVVLYVGQNQNLSTLRASGQAQSTTTITAGDMPSGGPVILIGSIVYRAAP